MSFDVVNFRGHRFDPFLSRKVDPQVDPQPGDSDAVETVDLETGVSLRTGRVELAPVGAAQGQCNGIPGTDTVERSPLGKTHDQLNLIPRTNLIEQSPLGKADHRNLIHRTDLPLLKNTGDQTSVIPRTDRVEHSQLEKVHDQPSNIPGTDLSPLEKAHVSRNNRPGLSPKSRPVLSQFRLSDYMPGTGVSRLNVSEMKYVDNGASPEESRSSTWSLNRGLSLSRFTHLESACDPQKRGLPGGHQTRTQSLLDLHKEFSPEETGPGVMNSRESLKSFSQSLEMDAARRMNGSCIRELAGCSENQVCVSPGNHVVSYTSGKPSNIPTGRADVDRSRTYIVKSTLCYNTSTQTDRRYTGDTSNGIVRRASTDVTEMEVTSPALPQKFELFGRVCEEKSVQTSVCADVVNPSMSVRHDEVLTGNKTGGRDWIHSRSVHRRQSVDDIRRSSCEYAIGQSSSLQRSQKNQTRYASLEVLNDDDLNWLAAGSNFSNTAPALDKPTGGYYNWKSDMFSQRDNAGVISDQEFDKVKTDSNNNNNKNNNTFVPQNIPGDSFHSDYASTNNSAVSGHKPSSWIVNSLKSPAGSQNVSYYAPKDISRCRLLSATGVDQNSGIVGSVSPLSKVDSGVHRHNLSTTSGVGSDISSYCSYLKSPDLDYPVYQNVSVTKSLELLPHAHPVYQDLPLSPSLQSLSRVNPVYSDPPLSTTSPPFPRCNSVYPDPLLTNSSPPFPRCNSVYPDPLLTNSSPQFPRSNLVYPDPPMINTSPPVPHANPAHSNPPVTNSSKPSPQNHVAPSPNASATTFQWKKIVILNPDHIKTSRRDSDSVFLDNDSDNEDDVESKYILYKDFQGKTTRSVALTGQGKGGEEHSVLCQRPHGATSGTEEAVKQSPRATLESSQLPLTPKPRGSRYSESLSLGQIEEEADAASVRAVKTVDIPSLRFSDYSLSGRGSRNWVGNDHSGAQTRSSIGLCGGDLRLGKPQQFMEDIAPGGRGSCGSRFEAIERNDQSGGVHGSYNLNGDNYRRDNQSGDNRRRDSQDVDNHRRDSQSGDNYRRYSQNGDSCRRDSQSGDNYRRDNQNRDNYKRDSQDGDSYRRDSQDGDKYRRDSQNGDKYRRDNRRRDSQSGSNYRSDCQSGDNQNGDNQLRYNSSDLSAFYKYTNVHHSSPAYSVISSHNLKALPKEPTWQIPSPLQHQYLPPSGRLGRDFLNASSDHLQTLRLSSCEDDSSTSDATLQDISSLDNSLASIRPQSLSETVAELISQVNENLTKSAQRMGRLRRSGSVSSRSSLDCMDTTRSERSIRRETDWTRIRSLGSLGGSPDSWSSFVSDGLNEDMLTSSTPRSSFALSKDRDVMSQSRGHDTSMDSGLVVSPTYESFTTNREPRLPTRPATNSSTEPPPPLPPGRNPQPPPPLPPRQNREKQTSVESVPNMFQETPTGRVSGREKHRIQVIALGKQKDEDDVGVDTSKMNFKDLMMQWKNNSPAESTLDSRRQEQRQVENHRQIAKLGSSVPRTFGAANTNFASTYKPELAQKAELKSVVSPPLSSQPSMPCSTSVASSSSSAFLPIAGAESSTYGHYPIGVRPTALHSFAAFSGFDNARSTSGSVVSSNPGLISDGAHTAVSSNRFRVAVWSQSPPPHTAQTPPPTTATAAGRISLLSSSRSRSSSDLLSDQLRETREPIAEERSPINLHRSLRDRSSSDDHIRTGASAPQQQQQQQQPTPPHPHDQAITRSPQGDNSWTLSRLQSTERPESITAKSAPRPDGGGMPDATARLSASTSELSNGLPVRDSIGFSEESYTGKKSRPSRAGTTYQRSISTAEIQLDRSGQTPNVPDNSALGDAKLGHQFWNSESVLPGTGTGAQTLRLEGRKGDRNHHGLSNGVSAMTAATPVRPPRPNARARQNAGKLSSSGTVSSNISQNTKLVSASLSSLDDLGQSASFIGGQSEILKQQQSQQLTLPLASSSPTMNTSAQDRIVSAHHFNSPGLTGDFSEHRLPAQPNTLSDSLSSASFGGGETQPVHVDNSSAKPPSPCSLNETPRANGTSQHHTRETSICKAVAPSPSVDNSSSSANSEFPSHFPSNGKMNSPRKSKPKSFSTPSLSHLRQPSQEEIECDEKAQELAEELDARDEKLLEVLKQDHSKKRMLYMDGLFCEGMDCLEKFSGQQKSGSAMKNRSLDRLVNSVEHMSSGFKSFSLPRDYQHNTQVSQAVFATDRQRGSNPSLDAATAEAQPNPTVIKHKEELAEKLERKMQVLKEEKVSLQQEIADNVLLGQQVCQVAISRCKTASEKEKFMTFIDDLEKIVRLLLNLSGQLARAENAVQTLGPEADSKLKKLTWDKREKLRAKHEEAQALKAAVDRRSDLLLTLLQDRLSCQELSDYRHFIHMKSGLTIRMQELDDHLVLAEQQMAALRRSLPG